jgi:hypothetical protein
LASPNTSSVTPLHRNAPRLCPAEPRRRTDRIEVEIVEMLGAAAHLAQEFGAADHLVEALHAELGEDVAHFLGDEGH